MTNEAIELKCVICGSWDAVSASDTPCDHCEECHEKSLHRQRGLAEGGAVMSNGFGPASGTVTVETWGKERTLRLLGEGCGAFAGLTVEDPKTGERVELPIDEEVVVVRVDYDDDERLQYVAIPFHALKRFHSYWNEEERAKRSQEPVPF